MVALSCHERCVLTPIAKRIKDMKTIATTAYVCLMIALCALSSEAKPEHFVRPPQCPSNIVNGIYLGCTSPGALCTIGIVGGLCGDSPNKTNCTCT
jgi:hypothetical protein